MTEDKNTNKTTPQPEEREIDLIELAQEAWAGRKPVLKVCGIALLVGLVAVFNILKEYSTSVTLAPETGSKSSAGGMGALAAMAGTNTGSSSRGDASSPELYPDIVSSMPFLLEMLDIKVTDQKGKINTTLYEYLDKHRRPPWWGMTASAPFKALGWVVFLFKDAPEELGDAKVNPFCLTPGQVGIADASSHHISVSIDKKAGVTTPSVTMQDPLISAALTDTVIHCLQNYITDHCTNKTRHDLALTEELSDEAQGNYYKAQQKYAHFMDDNQDIIMQSFRTEQERLRNEINLAYRVSTQVAQQLQVAKAKVQEITPVYTVAQPATVPLRPAKPNKIMVLIGFVFLAGIGSIGWILSVKDLLNGWKEQPEK